MNYLIVYILPNKPGPDVIFKDQLSLHFDNSTDYFTLSIESVLNVSILTNQLIVYIF